MMDELVVVGGLVPSLIIDQSTLSPETDAHVGTMDLDVGLTLAIFDEKRYEALSERLRRAGFVPDTNEEGRLTNQRWKITNFGHVTVDFLIPPSDDDRDQGGKLKHIQSDFAAIVTPGLRLAFSDRQRIILSGRTIIGEEASREIWVCGPGAYTVLKALAFDGRGENKDAYDLFYVLRNYGAGIGDIVARLRPLLPESEAIKAIDILKRDFLSQDGLGPRRVSEFIHGAPDDDTQADVVGFVRMLLKGLDG
jgi:predicted nucleotidyltransferase